MRIRFNARDAWRVAAALLAALAVNPIPAAAQRIDYGGYRPHYQGFGVTTPGGRGGTIYKVTTLDDSGPGSLRAALTAREPRFVLFEVSGTIALKSPILITSPFATIAGQTAPSPGILIRNHSIFIDTNDVVMQHLRLRMGDSTCVNNCASGGAAALYIRNNAFNVVLDHLSVSWGTHGGIAINAWSGPEPRDIAVLDSIVAENLANPSNPYGFGTLLMPSPQGTATFARNLHAHNGNRNPWVSSGWRFSGYNHVAYNATSVNRDAGTFAFFQLMGSYGYGGPFDAVWVSNVAIAGPNTHVDGKPVKVDVRADEVGRGHRLYVADNIGPHQSVAEQWRGVTLTGSATEERVRANGLPAWHVYFAKSVMPSSRVLSFVLANAGARPRDRDNVDKRIVQSVTSRTGSWISSPTQVGGYPVLATVNRPLTVPANPHAIVDAAGRTRIEAWLEAFARALEPSLPA
jgi:hypothetical protein